MNPNADISPPADVQKQKLPEPSFLPDENPFEFHNLRSAFMQDFLPETAYERSLVNDITINEWEKRRHRIWREKLIVNKFRELYDGFVNTGRMEPVMDLRHLEDMHKKQQALTQRARRETQQILKGGANLRAEFAAKLADKGTSAEEIMACAYAAVVDEVAHHEHAIAQSEKRRRHLVDDLHHLRGSRARTIDAEVDDR